MGEWQDSGPYGSKQLRYLIAITLLLFGLAMVSIVPLALPSRGVSSAGIVTAAFTMGFFSVIFIACAYSAYCIFKGWLMPLTITDRHVEFSKHGLMPKPAFRIPKGEIRWFRILEPETGTLAYGTHAPGRIKKYRTFPLVEFQLGSGPQMKVEVVNVKEAEEALKRLGYPEKQQNQSPELAETWYNAGMRLQQAGKQEEALKNFDKALEINPKHPEAWRQKGVALYALGLPEQAVECMRKAESLKQEGEKKA